MPAVSEIRSFQAGDPGGGPMRLAVRLTVLKMMARGRRLPVLCLAAVAACLSSGCDRPGSASADEARTRHLLRNVDGERAFDYVRRFVALGPRPSGSEGARRAAAWIADECRRIGWRPETDAWTESTPRGPCEFRNVIVRVPGDGRRFVVVGAHYDTKRIRDVPAFVGANDSGSGVGVLLELLRVLKTAGYSWNGPPLLVAFFDGEECMVEYGPEDGLFGSKRLAARLDEYGGRTRCLGVIVLDMIGDRDLTITLPQDTPTALANAVFSAAEAEGARDKVGYYLKSDSILDDHTPFQWKGVPAVDIIDFEFGPDNAWWHTGADTLDKISADSLAVVGRLCLRVILRMARDRR